MSFLSDLDTNQDGQVDLSEWVSAGHDAAVFDAFDVDDDGFITQADLDTFLPPMPLPAAPNHAAPVYPHDSDIGTPRSGLLQLRNAVAAYFESYAVPVEVPPVGLRYRSFNLNQSFPANANRVVFIPGKFDGNETPRARDYGVLSRESMNHAQVINPRELVAWERPFTISCWSAPVPGQKTDEGATLNLAEDLLEQVVRAVHESGLADITWGNVVINSPNVENGFGVELLVSASQLGPIFGVTLDYVQPTAGTIALSAQATTTADDGPPDHDR